MLYEVITPNLRTDIIQNRDTIFFGSCCDMKIKIREIHKYQKIKMLGFEHFFNNVETF